jgi:hypothetical protein
MKKQNGDRLATAFILHSSFCLHTFPCGALVDERGNVIGIVSAKLGCFNSIGHERLAPGECELRGQELVGRSLLRRPF